MLSRYEQRNAETGMERKGEEGEKKNGFGRYNSSGTDGVGGVSLFPWLP